MSPELWKELEVLFDQVVALPAVERDLFLAQQTVGNAELRRLLERMIEEDTRGRQRIAGVIRGAASLTVEKTPDWTGRKLGPYKVVREVGRGGMGTVFEAVRDDDAFKKQVAIKVATRMPYSESFRERFRHERQILAQLEHPNIARLLDGGTTEEGIPFFAMEFVEGRPIAAFCKEKSLPIRQRVQLFLQICSAVEYAHQSLIVHRDLKPGNILVNQQGTPKLLDFGIAKLLDPGSMDAVPTQTNFAPVTPDYCSPEQIRGANVTTRTDVYTLGLVLFEILCEERGQVADISNPVALDHSICDVAVPAPSTRAAARGNHELAKQLRGDLDTIILAATQKQPERRYATVAQLSSDLENYLAGRPVTARRDSVWYRTGKFVRRNWLAVGAAAVVLVTLVGGIVAITIQARRSARRFDQVRGIARALMVDVHTAIQPLAGSVPAQQVVVKTALDYLDSLSREAANDPNLQLEIGEGYARIGKIQGDFLVPSLGKRDEALASFRKAEQTLEALVRRSPSSTDAAVALAEVHREMGTHFARTGAAGEGIRRFEAAASLLGDAARSQPNNAMLLRKQAKAIAEWVRETAGRARISAEQAVRPVAILEPLVEKDPSNLELRSELGISYSTAGAWFFNERRTKEALAYFEKNLETHKVLVAAQPQNTTYRRLLMLAYSKIGDSYWGFPGISLGDREKALANFRGMAEQAEWMHGADPGNRSVRIDFAMSLMRYGSAMAARDPQGLATLNRSLVLMDEIVAADPRNSALRRQQIDLCLRVAGRHMEIGNRDAAVEVWNKGVSIGEAVVQADPKYTGGRTWLLRVYLELGREMARRKQRGAAGEIARKASTQASDVATLSPRDPGCYIWPPRVAAWTAELHELLGDSASARAAFETSAARWREIASQPNLPKDVQAEMEKALARAAR